MALEIFTAPGYVFVTCGGETVVVSGMLVPPPSDAPTRLPKPVSIDGPTIWLPPSAPSADEPPPPKTGRGPRGISTQIANITVPGIRLSAFRPTFNELVASQAFCEFTRTMPGSYALTVTPKSKSAANATSKMVTAQSPSVLMKQFNSNG